jgi:uncharacterized protein YndB with AHSA1/START domain
MTPPANATDRSTNDTVVFDFDLNHPPEKVWRALTDPALLSEWLLPVTGIDLKPGTNFTFRTQPYPGWDGVVHCRMVEIEPQRKLKYTWAVGDMSLDTIVTFTLTPTSTGTRLSLVQTGFKPEQKRESGGARYGWKSMGAKLTELLERTA